MSSHLTTATAAPSPTGSGPLPREYGVTRLVLLPRDPKWMHAYWEIAPYTWDEARRQFGAEIERGRPVLRMHSERAGQSRAIDVDVRIDARNWYVFTPVSDGQWHAELGLILPDGRFVLLALSNTIRLPAGRVSDVTDERWGVLRADWERLFELSGGGRLGAGSLDMARMLAQRWELLTAVSSWAGPAVGLGSVTSPGGASSWSRPPERHKGKGFWLIADTEVIVYGATEPDARVKFQGKAIALNADGTFSFRFALPDGEQVFPIEATDRDGDLGRSIEFRVTRSSRRSED